MKTAPSTRHPGCEFPLALLCLWASLFLHGCGPGEPAPEPPPAAAVQSIVSGEVTPSASPRLTLPADFPRAVPLLPRRLIHGFNPRDDGSLSLTCSMAEDRRVVADFYRREMAEGGWKVTLDSLSGGMVSIAARRGDGRRLTVNIIENPGDQRTMLGLYYQPAAES